jgi:hypothetical protein
MNSLIAHVLFSSRILIWRGKKTIRWLNVGKRMPTALFSSWVQCNFRITSPITSETTVQFIFCCCCCICQRDGRLPQAKLSGYLYILSREHVSTSSRQFQPSTTTYSSHSSQTTTLLSPGLYDLGELALVLEPDCQSDLCPAGHNVTTVDPSLR